jgi:fatty-acyl-CoA synthase
MGKSKNVGENLASSEVDGAIYKLPAVAEETVIGPTLARWVEAMWTIVALKTGTMLDEVDAAAHCTQQLGTSKVTSGNCGKCTRSCS